MPTLLPNQRLGNSVYAAVDARRDLRAIVSLKAARLQHLQYMSLGVLQQRKSTVVQAGKYTGTSEAYKTRVQDMFDRRSPVYDVNDGMHPPLCQQLVRFADITPGSHVLDVACGTGLVALEAATLVGDQGRVVGIDITQSMLDKAVEKVDPAFKEVVTFECVDAETASFPAESFSHVLIANGMAYLSDIPAAVKRMKKWLRPGGVLAFNNPKAPMIPLTDLVIELAASKFGVDLVDAGSLLGSHERIQNVFDAAGFTDLQVAETAQEYIKADCSPQQFATNIFKLLETFPTTPMNLLLEDDQIDELRRSYMPPATRQAEVWVKGNDIVLPYTLFCAKAVA